MGQEEMEPLSSGYGVLLGGARPMVDLKVIVDHILERLHAEFGQLLQAMALETDHNRCA